MDFAKFAKGIRCIQRCKLALKMQLEKGLALVDLNKSFLRSINKYTINFYFVIAMTQRLYIVIIDFVTFEILFYRQGKNYTICIYIINMYRQETRLVPPLDSDSEIKRYRSIRESFLSAA